MLEFIDEIEKQIPRDDTADFGEQMLLYSLIRATQPETVVETGTHKGMTALFMAQGLHDNDFGVLYTAEPNQSMWGAKGNFRKFPELENRIIYFEGMGKDMEVDGKIDLLFVDSEHEKEVVMGEMEHFMPQLSENAVVVFHDCGGDNERVGVNAAIKELGLNAVILPTVNTMRIYGHRLSIADKFHAKN